jgi:molybdopterin adenylyltransferase
MRVAVLTISDSVSSGKSVDGSGPAVIARCKSLGWEIVSSAVCADDRPAIEKFLTQTADSNAADLVLTTGGTGLGPRDVTPEATAAVIDRAIPGFSEQMRIAGAQKTPRAILSRGAAGIRGTVLIINLPGSPAGAVESLDVVAGLLPHAVAIIHGAKH